MARQGGVEARGWDPTTRRRPRIKGDGLVAATCRHLASRNLDPQRHTHSVVANMTHNQEDEWRSADFIKIEHAKHLIGAPTEANSSTAWRPWATRRIHTNLLIHAHRRESRLGDAAHTVMTGLAEGVRAWAIPWPCCYEFLSVVTNRRICKDEATTSDQAWHQFQAWPASPSNRMIGETEDFLEILQRIVNRPHVVGGVVHDARIVAVCVAHGVEALLTRHRDFALFPELPTHDPFAVGQGLPSTCESGSIR